MGIFTVLAVSAACGSVWADDAMFTPPWVDDFAKGKTEGKVPPEVKTKEKEKPIAECTKTNKDGSTETDVAYFDSNTGETTTIEYIKTRDKNGKPKTVWKIKVEKPGQPTNTTTYDPEPSNPTKTEQTDDKPPTTSTYDPNKAYASTDVGYGPGVTIGEPPLPEVTPGQNTSVKKNVPPTTPGGNRSGEIPSVPPTTPGGNRSGEKPSVPPVTPGGNMSRGGGGTTTETASGAPPPTGGGGGGKTTETGGGGGGGKTTERVERPKKPKEPPWNLKLVTYGGPPGETVIHFGEKPKTTPEEYVRKNPKPTWDHGDGDNPKVPVETTHYVPGQIVTEHRIPHNDKPHVTETVKFPGETWTEITPDGWVNIGSGWAYVRIPVSFVYECAGETQEVSGAGGGQTQEKEQEQEKEKEKETEKKKEEGKTADEGKGFQYLKNFFAGKAEELRDPKVQNYLQTREKLKEAKAKEKDARDKSQKLKDAAVAKDPMVKQLQAEVDRDTALVNNPYADVYGKSAYQEKLDKAKKDLANAKVTAGKLWDASKEGKDAGKVVHAAENDVRDAQSALDQAGKGLDKDTKGVLDHAQDEAEKNPPPKEAQEKVVEPK